MGLLQTYLLAYNTLSLAGWTYVFAATAAYGTAATWGVVVLLQYLATLELAHAALGLVRTNAPVGRAWLSRCRHSSPPPTCVCVVWSLAMQVRSSLGATILQLGGRDFVLLAVWATADYPAVFGTLQHC